MLTEEKKLRSISHLRILISFACVLTGLLAGESLDRYLLQVPAWHNVDIVAWANFVRHADLSLRGMFLYPVEAIGSTLLLVAASIIVLKNREHFYQLTAPLVSTTCLALIGLGLTALAAPHLLSVRTMPDNPELLQEQFNQFHFWGQWRALAQILSFFTCLWAMAKVFGMQKEIKV